MYLLKMKVLYVIDPGTVGGATVAFFDLIIQMQKMKVETVVLTSQYNEFNTKLENIGVNTIVDRHKTVLGGVASGIRRPISFLKRWIMYRVCEARAIQHISKQLDLSTIDLIHTNSARNSIGCLISKKYGIPHIMHIREFADKDFSCVSFRNNYIEYYNQFSERFLAVSDAVKEHWIKKGINKKKILTVYDGVRYDNIRLSTDESKKDNILKLVIVGGVVQTKGQDLAVRAISLLPEELKYNVILDIVGWYDEKYVNSMKRFADDNRIASQVRFLGSRDDVHCIIGDYHVGLMCSKSEGFGLVTAEYMHAQLGVIASNSGASPELIVNGVCGLTFEVGNAKDLARCIETYYRNRDLLIKHSHAAKERALSNFTDAINAENIFSVYKDLLKN